MGSVYLNWDINMESHWPLEFEDFDGIHHPQIETPVGHRNEWMNVERLPDGTFVLLLVGDDEDGNGDDVSVAVRLSPKGAKQLRKFLKVKS